MNEKIRILTSGVELLKREMSDQTKGLPDVGGVGPIGFAVAGCGAFLPARRSFFSSLKRLFVIHLILISRIRCFLG